MLFYGNCGITIIFITYWDRFPVSAKIHTQQHLPWRKQLYKRKSALILVLKLIPRTYGLTVSEVAFMKCS